MKKAMAIALSLLMLLSCTDKTQPTQSKKTQPEHTPQSKTEATTVKSKPAQELPFKKVDVATFPVSEDTSFDTYDESYRQSHPTSRVYSPLTKEQVHKLGLQSWLKIGSNFSVNYELPYSKNFRTFVFTYQKGEMELSTVMVTFDQNNTKIDELEVAYDEIAESWLWTKSNIAKNKIEVKEYSGMDEETKITTTVYRLDKNGHFKTISKSKPIVDVTNEAPQTDSNPQK